MRQRNNAAMLALVLAASACARVLPPPGGERDQLPPRLVSTFPEPLEVLQPFTGPVIFRFDERLSERGFSEALVLVSPLDGALRVDRGGSEVRVRIDGGWRPNRVYRVVLLPGVRDLFGNERRDPAELVFSTGPEILETALGGIVLDRLTGRPPANAVVSAVRRGDAATYMAVTDGAGFFALRHLPLGEYDVLAFADQNRNRRRDPAEPFDQAVVTLATAADTSALVFHVLAPDTTPPRVTRAEAIDSMRVRVTFDDAVDAEEPLRGAGAAVYVLPDSTHFAGVRRLLPAPQYDRERQLAAAQRDTAVAGPPVQAGRPPGTGRAGAALLPTRDIIIELDRNLVGGYSYVVLIAGVTNLHGMVGGGSARFEVRAAAPAPAPPDTAGARR